MIASSRRSAPELDKNQSSARRPSWIWILPLLVLISTGPIFVASATPTYTIGIAKRYIVLPDGGRDPRALGIFVGTFASNVSNPCSQDAGQPFMQALAITVYNALGIDGGTFVIGANPDGGVGATLALLDDGGYQDVPQFAASGSVSLGPVVSGTIAGSYMATLVTGGKPLVDAGTTASVFSVQMCP